MTLHTPGPWTLGTGHGTARDHAICAGPVIIAKVVGNGYPIGSGWWPESAANARLLGASLELAQALEYVIAAFDAPAWDGEELAKSIDAARAVLRKAIWNE